MTSTSLRARVGRPSAILLAGVTAIALGYGGSAIAGAEAQGPSAKPVTKAQVKKIAKAQAIKQINALAPTLSVKSAQTATSATTATTAQSAQTAVTAQSAATAAKIGTAEVKTFGVDIATGGPTVTLGTVNGLSLIGSCPGGVPTLVATAAAAGKLRYEYVSGTTTVLGNGFNAWTTGTVNDTAGSLGSGMLAFKPAATSTGMNAWYGWRLDGTTCSFFGTMLGG